MATHVLARLVLALGQEEGSDTGASFRSRMFSEMGQEIRAIADRYGLPRDHAAEIVQTLGIVSVVLFGPAFTTRYIEGFPEESVIRLTDCALFREESAHGIPPSEVNSLCQAYVRHAVEALNPAFTISVTRARCRGDIFCEMVIERRKP